MRILCVYDSGDEADSAIRLGWKRVFTAAGHDFTLWNPADKPAFDAFDEASPDLFIDNGVSSTAIAKCLAEPRRSRTVTHVAAKPQPAADTFLYGQAHARDGLYCQLAYVGNYRPDKKSLLDAYVGDLVGLRNLKIFGRTRWPYEAYIGQIDEDTIADLYLSATLCVNVASGGRTSARVYNILLAGGTCITNALTDNVFPEDMLIQFKSPDRYLSYIKAYPDKATFIDTQMARSFVLHKHTYWHRCRDILAMSGFDREAIRLMETYRATVRL